MRLPDDVFVRHPTGETRVYAVLGHPVHHSLSPAMQNAAFQVTGRNATYVALDVPPERLGEALKGLHAAGLSGLNLTSPHKEAAWPFLHAATEEARLARVVNTLRREDTGWRGHSTDGLGFAAWLSSLGIALQGVRLLVLGVGGAVRSIVPVLASHAPAGITIVSRDGARARAAATWIGTIASAGADLSAAAMDDSEAAQKRGPWDLLIRALASSTIGMPEAAWWSRLSRGAPVLDLNYGSRAADARSRAGADGRRFEDGRGLLLYQGALSFEFWTGESAPLEVMRSALTECET